MPSTSASWTECSSAARGERFDGVEIEIGEHALHEDGVATDDEIGRLDGDRKRDVGRQNDGATCAAQALDRAADQFLARLRQHHQRDVVRHQLLLDEISHGLEIRVGCGRETHFDFLEADADQRLEQPLLGLAAHGLEERLVAVAQIRAAPHRHGS